MKLRRAIFWCGAVLLALLAVAALALALAVHRPQLIRPLVQRALAPRGGSASLAGFTIALSPPSLSLSGLAIAGPSREGDLLRLDRLTVLAAPGRLLTGGLWLRRVEVKGLVLERPRPRGLEGPPDLTPITRLFDIEELSLADVRLHLAVAGGTVTADGIRLDMAPGDGGTRRFHGDGALAFRRDGATVAFGRLAARGNVTREPAIEAILELSPARLDVASVSGNLSARADLRVTRDGLQARRLGLFMPQARLGPDSRAKVIAAPVRVDAAGNATLDFRALRLDLRAFDAGGLLRARGRIDAPTLETLSGTLVGELPRVEGMMDLLGPLLPAGMRALALRGALPFRIALAGPTGRRTLTLELRPRELALSWPDGALACRFGGIVTGAGPVPGWLRDGGTLAWTLSIGTGKMTFHGRPLPLGNVEMRGSARTTGGSVRVERFDVRSETVGFVTGNLSFREGKPSGALSGRGLPAAALFSLAGAMSGRDWNGWSPNGAVDVAARIEPAEDGPRVAATVALARIGFSSPTGDLMGQNLSGRLDIDARLAPGPRLAADLAMSGGEALWGPVYVDFGKDPLVLHAGATRASPDEYRGIRLDGDAGSFGRLRAAGQARRVAGRWRSEGTLVLSEARLGPLFRTFVRDPLAASHPDLAQLSADGTAGLDLSLSVSDKTADLSGRLSIRSGDVRRDGGAPIVSGLDVDLPIAYSLGVPDPGRPRPADAGAWGRLNVKGLHLGNEELGPLHLPVVVVPNRLYLGDGIDLSPLGAALHLRRIQVDEPLSGAFRIAFAARLEGLDLARLSGGKPGLEGRIAGVLDPVTIGRERLTAAGDLSGDLFGGHVDIRRVTVDRPFDPGREIGGDADVRLLDLERLSAALGVGRITGRLSGSLAGLRVAYGQPVAFHLRMESVPTKGVPQTVSLKAVNSISLVSTGSALSGLGASFITTFFREFPYEKMGVECALKNDVFTVRGLIHEDGVEYLLKRPLFAGINVINRNPDNRIGFSDMLDRARRVTAGRPQ